MTSLTACLCDSDVEKANKKNFWRKAFPHDFYIFLSWDFWEHKISQRLQHGFTLPHNLDLVYVCHRRFCWLMSLKAYQGPLWWHARDLAGLFLIESGSCSWISMGILSAVSRVLVTGLEAEVWTCVKSKQLKGSMWDTWDTPTWRRESPLRPLPALLFSESRKFPDIIADYFHFPVELSDNAQSNNGPNLLRLSFALEYQLKLIARILIVRVQMFKMAALMSSEWWSSHTLWTESF